MIKKVYFISGLGADKRAFSLLNLSFCEAAFVDWIQPEKNESLKEYALRLRLQIPEEHPTIVGVSFGGMLATEMAKTDDKIKAIIIASNKSPAEFPGYFRLAKFLPAYKLLTGTLIKNSTKLNWVFGAKGDEQKKLINSIVADADPAFLKWAIGAILRWNEPTQTLPKGKPPQTPPKEGLSNAQGQLAERTKLIDSSQSLEGREIFQRSQSSEGKNITANVIHIHGTADRLLPFRYVKADIAVLHGTHLMSLNMPKEISELLKELIEKS